MFSYNNGFAEGYFVSQEQADAALGKLVRAHSEAEKHLTLLKHEALELSKLFTGLGSVVKPENVWNISLESYEPYLSKTTYDAIAKLRTGIRETESELQRLNTDLKKFGTR